MSAYLRRAARFVTREWRWLLGYLVAGIAGLGAAWSTATLLVAWLAPPVAALAGAFMCAIVGCGISDVADTHLRVGAR